MNKQTSKSEPDEISRLAEKIYDEIVFVTGSDDVNTIESVLRAANVRIDDGELRPGMYIQSPTRAGYFIGRNPQGYPVVETTCGDLARIYDPHLVKIMSCLTPLPDAPDPQPPEPDKNAVKLKTADGYVMGDAVELCLLRQVAYAAAKVELPASAEGKELTNAVSELHAYWKGDLPPEQPGLKVGDVAMVHDGSLENEPASRRLCGFIALNRRGDCITQWGECHHATPAEKAAFEE